MNVITKHSLTEFWDKYHDSKKALILWLKTIQGVTRVFKNSDFIGNSRIVFNIKRNKYRLIVEFDFERQKGFIKFIGSHKAYDKADAKRVTWL